MDARRNGMIDLEENALVCQQLVRSQSDVTFDYVRSVAIKCRFPCMVSLCHGQYYIFACKLASQSQHLTIYGIVCIISP